MSAATDAITEAIEWTLAALCVETTAICQAVNAATFAYLNDRKQFGMPFVRFQALQFAAAHRAQIDTNEARAAKLETLILDPAASTGSGLRKPIRLQYAQCPACIPNGASLHLTAEG